MVTVERRRPRTSFTRVLERICQRLDERRRVTICWKDVIFHRRESKEFEITQLWVAGSYARGAMTCGDLDVILGVNSDGWRSAHQIAARLFGVQPDVRFYSGSPDNNSSHVAFPEAIHVWSPGFDWRAALGSIREDPQAGRFSRPHDIIPLRPEQMGCAPDDLERLVKLRNDGHLDWRFVPFEPRSEPEPQDVIEEHIVSLIQSSWGKQSRAIFPFIWDYLKTSLPFITFSGIEQAELDCGGVHVAVGRPRIADDLLDKLAFSRVALMPHLSRRGPNGIFEIRRGQSHPLELTMANVGWRALKTAAGKFVTRLRPRQWSRLGATGIQLFSTEELAMHAADRLEGKKSRGPFVTKSVLGPALLDLVSHADYVELRVSRHRARPHAITYFGADALGQSPRLGNDDLLIRALSCATG